ncbi:T9SS sorting signal type C domain-containing protein [Flavobacterium sp. LC2016-12]|uniref:T9SS sorting signal type C domain-containing protein n=1 Tax=Flavobacterium sp. LC2016-12 TaxID=2783794 RepID=UPI00188BE303|nr:T9SS sorting signal type C domain-containing protein [Flavobacterium sp. LC2016-12]
MIFFGLSFNITNAQCNSGATAGTVSSNDNKICAGSSLVFWSAGGWSAGGSWSSSNPSLVQLSPSGANINVKGISPGTVDIIYTVTQANCSEIKTAKKTISILGPTFGAVGQISGTTSQCNGNTNQVYTIPEVPGGAVYNWNVPNGNGWSIVSGQNTNSIIANIGAGNGNISVTVSNTCASASSSVTRTFAVTVSNNKTATPTISGITSLCSGGNVTLTSSDQDSYLWSTGQTTKSITVSTAGSYTVKTTKSGSCQSDSSAPANVTVGTATAITTQPTAPTATCAGTGTRTISVVATGTVLSYSWRKGSTAVSNTGAISGQGTSTLTFTNPLASDAGNYDVVITGSCNNVTSNPVAVTINSAPAITIQPTAPTATCSGTGTKTISVTATGTNLTYLWKKDGTAIINDGVYTGLGTATLTLTNPTTANQGNYTVDISGDCTATPITSNSVVVTVNAASSAPTGISGTTTIQSGNNTTLSVTGGSLGTGATVEWFTGSCGGTSAGTGNSITVSPTSNTTYYVRYKGTCNTTTCASVVVTVTPPPCIPAGDQTTYGTNSWIGYVYSSSSSTPPNPSTNTTLPIGANMTYIGRVEEPQLFNRDVVQGAVTGVNPQLCGTPPLDNFFVRYKMKTTVAATGTYNITLGGDDLYRLYINDQKVIEQWTGQNYTQKAINITLTAGVEYRFDIEYYEKTTDSRIQFSMGLIAGDNQNYEWGENLWKVYGFTTAVENNTNFTLAKDSYAGYFSTTPVNINTVNSFAVLESPSFNPAVSGWQGAPVPKDFFTLAYKRHGFPCGAYKIEIAHRDNNVQIYLNENTTTPIFTGSYSNSPEFVGGGTGTVYNLNKDSKIEIRLKDYKDNAQLIINFIPVETIYTENSPVPSNTTAITISSNTTLQTDLEVCSCTIKPGITLTVPADKTLTVNQNLTIGTGGKLLLQNNSSLLQNSTTADAFTGDFDSFVVQRNTAPVRRYDFTFWSSPVTRTPAFTLADISPLTLYDKYYSYVPGTGWKISIRGVLPMEPGIGYIIRAPQNYDLKKAEVYPASFTGKPNNGDYFITNVPGENILVGNPYPSALDAKKFIQINHDANADVGALYFWTHNSPPSIDVEGDAKYNYTTSDYAVYSLTGGVATSKGATTEGYKTGPTGKIASGQAFFITGSTTNPIRFTNDMRVGGNNSQFFKTTDSEDKDKNRIWLNLTNEQGAFKQTLIGYLDGATNSWDINYDGPTLDGNTYVDFYSINETNKLTIQGRALPFSDTDVIPLGYVSSIVGDFTISIDHTDGLFDTQAVYLEDKTTGKTVDLRAANYTFATEKGTFEDRFVLSYTNKTLGTGDFENIENGLLVSVKDKVIKVTSAKENIKEVTIFDINGKQLQTKNKIGSTELLISNLQAANQVLLVKVTLENHYVVTKKIVFQ